MQVTQGAEGATQTSSCGVRLFGWHKPRSLQTGLQANQKFLFFFNGPRPRIIFIFLDV